MQMAMTFGEAAEWCRLKAAEIEEAKGKMAQRGAEIIADEAKAELGTYQPGVGPYDAWAQLAQLTEQERARLGFNPDGPLFRSGELRDSIEVHTEGNTAVVGTNKKYAVALENGTPKTPARPFLGRAAFVKQDEIRAEQAAILASVLNR